MDSLPHLIGQHLPALAAALAAAISIAVLAGLLVAERRRSVDAQGRAAEARRRADQAETAKRQLIHHLGHELRNPLNAILGLTELALGADDSASGVREHVEAIRGAAQQISMVANNLFAYYLRGEGGLPRHDAAFNVPRLLEDIRAGLLATAVERRLFLELTVEIGAPQEACLDPHLVRLIISNVVAHALGLTAVGHVSMTAHAPEFASTMDATTIHVSVADTAIMPQQFDSESMFEPYGMETQLTSAVRPGTGLNLFVARNVARQLGGDVSHRRHPNGGSVYDIVLPAQIQSLTTAPDGQAPDGVLRFDAAAARHRQTVAPLRILVTEDQESNQQLLQQVLFKGGHAVTIAANGPSAMALLARDEYDLMLLDLRLPGMSGLEVLKLNRLQANSPNRTIPVIVVTGETSTATRQACVDEGADAFLAKPISGARLMETVAAVMARRRELAQHAAPGALARAASYVSTHTTGVTPRVVSALMEHALTYANAADRAARAGDYAAVRRQVRAIRGIAVSLRAHRLRDICAKLDGMRDDEWEDRPAVVAELLEQGLSHTKRSFEALYDSEANAN